MGLSNGFLFFFWVRTKQRDNEMCPSKGFALIVFGPFMDVSLSERIADYQAFEMNGKALLSHVASK